VNVTVMVMMLFLCVCHAHGFGPKKITLESVACWDAFAEPTPKGEVLVNPEHEFTAGLHRDNLTRTNTFDNKGFA
jgi:hypothetical protein